MPAGAAAQREAVQGAARWFRPVALVLVAIYLVAAVVSGLDRSSLVVPQLAGVMGWPYDTLTARRHASDALAANQPRDAEAAARRALASDPVDPSVIGLLGWSALRSGDAARAEAAFRVSGTMGWRDPYTQLFWIDRGLALGAADSAAERLDALLRQSPGLPNADPLFAAMTASVEGRAALAGRLAEQPNWGATFLQAPRTLPVDQLANRVDVIRRTPARALDCAAMGAMADSLINAQLIPEAEEVWRKACGATSALVYDGGFARLDPTRTGARAFDWQVPARGDMALTLDPATNDGRVVTVRVSGAVSQPVLRQAMVLAPGAYRLTWAMPEMPEGQVVLAQAGLGCGYGRQLAGPGLPLTGTAGRYYRDFALDAACSVRVLTFWVAPGADVRLADVQLVRTGP
ncbi:hypothetical protein [Novosphingobium sp.]|uniref:hypothetical protein n=1 Tax=Novosphingobium sp. TaxID=1874826 RepID=UPI002FDDD1EE